MSSRVGQRRGLVGETAPDLLRPDGRAKAPSRRPGTARSRASRRAIQAGPDGIMPGLPSGWRVIAPREVDEMARTQLAPALPSLVRMAVHLRDLPARRGRCSMSSERPVPAVACQDEPQRRESGDPLRNPPPHAQRLSTNDPLGAHRTALREDAQDWARGGHGPSRPPHSARLPE